MIDGHFFFGFTIIKAGILIIIRSKVLRLPIRRGDIVIGIVEIRIHEWTRSIWKRESEIIVLLLCSSCSLVIVHVIRNIIDVSDCRYSVDTCHITACGNIILLLHKEEHSLLLLLCIRRRDERLEIIVTSRWCKRSVEVSSISFCDSTTATSSHLFMFICFSYHRIVQTWRTWHEILWHALRWTMTIWAGKSEK